MKRRAFVGLAGSALMSPAGGFAQQPMRTIGYLTTGTAADWTIAPIRKGLAEEGFVEGRNLSIVFKAANGDTDRLAALADELVTAGVSLIVATGGPVPARSAKARTSTIPIVFAYGGDPVADGLVASLNRPGGNVTGATFIGASMTSKRLELLRGMLPRAHDIALMVNPKNTLAEIQVRDLKAATDQLGLALHVVNASDAAGVDEAFKALDAMKVDALLIGVDPTLGLVLPERIVALAARYRIPTMYDSRASVEKGGLVYYGAVLTDAWYQAGLYVGRILKGAKPQDLPVQQATRFETVINQKTAKALGLEIPERLLLAADDVIE